jgi:hypothetical protein
VLPHCEHIPGCWSVGSYALGLERSTVRLHGEAYLTRFILYIAGRTVRLHRFHRGDDARAFHDHPWPFWTFPTRTYRELTQDACAPWGERLNTVRAWRLHYRPSSYRHIVLQPYKPFWTVVITGRRDRGWGFWPAPAKFIPWREWR